MRGDAFFSTIARKPPFTKLHPAVAGFLKNYLAREKVVRFGDQFVVNTHFPPYPSPAFDRLVEQFGAIGEATTRRLYSVTLAVTNRCPFLCWHCYNAGRRQQDLPGQTLRDLAIDLQSLGARSPAANPCFATTSRRSSARSTRVPASSSAPPARV